MIYLKEDDISDINRIDEYNEEYMSVYPDFVPFMTKENIHEVLKDTENKKQGINNDGVKEIFYFAIEDDKIVGHGSVRLNPEIVPNYETIGHIMYGVVPSKRKQGYGTKICKLLIEEAKKYNLENILITCNEKNIGSNKVILNNGGEFIKQKMSEEEGLTNIYKIK